jgi:hypothetical protein
MGVVRCEVCRGYAADGEHVCHGLRSVDWVRFLHALRDWTTLDPHGRFEVFYAEHSRNAPA